MTISNLVDFSSSKLNKLKGDFVLFHDKTVVDQFINLKNFSFCKIENGEFQVFSYGVNENVQTNEDTIFLAAIDYGASLVCKYSSFNLRILFKLCIHFQNLIIIKEEFKFSSLANEIDGDLVKNYSDRILAIKNTSDVMVDVAKAINIRKSPLNHNKPYNHYNKTMYDSGMSENAGKFERYIYLFKNECETIIKEKYEDFILGLNLITSNLSIIPIQKNGNKKVYFVFELLDRTEPRLNLFSIYKFNKGLSRLDRVAFYEGKESEITREQLLAAVELD